MTLQLAAWTVPTFSPAFEPALILHEPVSGNLVMMPVGGTSTQPLYTSSLSTAWTSATGLNANFDAYANGVVANGVIVVAGNILSPWSRAVSRSTDGGVTWTTTSLESTTGFTYNRVAYDSTYDTFLHYSQGEAPATQVRESTDNGATWSAPVGVTVPAGYDDNNLSLSVAGGSGLGVLVCSCTTATDDGMLYSTDGGYTFLEGTITGDYDGTSFGIQYGTIWCGDRWVVPFSDGTGTGFLTSVDGITWVTVRPTWSTAPASVTALAWNDTAGWLYAGTDDGIYLSSNFTTFTLVDPASFAGTGAFPDAAWFGNVVVQIDTVFAATVNPILYALASDDGNVVISGLSYLEGMEVSVVNNGVVIASPNNPAYSPVIVTGGTITLVGPLTGTVTVGLPYTTDIQTLDIDSVGTTIKDRGVQVGGVICWVEDTGKFYAGPIVPTGDTLTGLEAFVPTNDQGYATTSNVTGVAEVTLQATYNNTGRVLIRQVDPTPLTILSIAPTGFLNGGR